MEDWSYAFLDKYLSIFHYSLGLGTLITLSFNL